MVAKSFDLALEQKYKTKCKRFGLWIIRKVIAYFQPYFFYTKRCGAFKTNIVNLKKLLFLPILFLLISCNQKQKQINTWNNRIAEYKTESELISAKNNADSKNRTQVADTITNWQFYKDSELLFKSNMFDSNRFTAEIKTSENYEYLILNMFYDFNNEIMKRKIDLVYKDKILVTFTDENRSRSPFRIRKQEIDKIISGNVGKEMFINYTDPINKNGMTVGILKFTDE